MWYRIFAADARMPDPALLEEFLSSRFPSVAVEFAADATGWYQAELRVEGVSLQLERYLSDEPGLRAELNSWAAWLETRENAPEHVRLMERMIQTTQLFTLHSEEQSPRADTICVELCRFLASLTDGVYQIDDSGFFAADGTLLVAE